MKRSKINAVSKRRKREGAIYSRERMPFLEDNPECLICAPGCTRWSEVVHHSKGRTGALFLNKKYWMAACWQCNNYLESHKAWGIEHGFRLDRIGNL